MFPSGAACHLQLREGHHHLLGLILVLGSLGCGNSRQQSKLEKNEFRPPKEIVEYQAEENRSARQHAFDLMVENEGEALRLKYRPIYQEAGKKAVETFIKRVYGEATSDELKALGERSKEDMTALAETSAEKLATSLKQSWIARRQKDFAASEAFISQRIVTIVEEKDSKDSFRELLKQRDKILEDGLVEASREIKKIVEDHLETMTHIGKN